MVAGFVPPDAWVEQASQLRTSGQVKLDSNGKGFLSFTSNSSNQRWVITSIVVSSNQSSTALCVPWATIALNTTDISQMSQGNQLGTGYNSSQNTFSGAIDVGPMDFISVLFYPPSGASSAQNSALVGVISCAVVLGTKYTRRR